MCTFGIYLWPLCYFVGAQTCPMDILRTCLADIREMRMKENFLSDQFRHELLGMNTKPFSTSLVAKCSGCVHLCSNIMFFRHLRY